MQKPTGKQHIGWNTDFEPCPVFKTTAKRIGILSPTLGILYLNRAELERDGRVYHSKPHEYFYRVKPAVDPEKPKPSASGETIKAFNYLGLDYPSPRKEVEKAYKRLAKRAHPDTGGTHDDFIELNNAYRIAEAIFGGKI